MVKRTHLSCVRVHVLLLSQYTQMPSHLHAIYAIAHASMGDQYSIFTVSLPSLKDANTYQYLNAIYIL